MTSKIAIVVDASGSMAGLIDLFQIGTDLQLVELASHAALNSKLIEDLLQKYEHVYLFTDSDGKAELGPYAWELLFDNRFHVINVSELPPRKKRE